MLLKVPIVISETVIWRIKGENCDGTDSRMGVAATLPELSEWTLRLIATLATSHKNHLNCLTVTISL